MNYVLRAPVLLVVFNRPEQTKRVFEAIRRARPRELYIVADGPRNPEENGLCKDTRAIVELIDWDCNVRRNYSPTNLGCKVRVSSGISWVFEHTDRAIILEDDCVPDQSFFPYCEELLERYADDPKVMHISGTNFLRTGHRRAPAGDSYYFSQIPIIWGWATWRRAWSRYDVHIAQWPHIRERRELHSIFKDSHAADYWSALFDRYYAGRIDSWDGQWGFSCFVNRGLCITPSANLVTNIGFGNTATHTRNSSDRFSRLSTKPMRFPLHHPADLTINAAADDYLHRHVFGVAGLWYHRYTRLLRRSFPHLYSNLRAAILGWWRARD